MGYFVGLPLGGAAEKDCQVRFGKNMTFQVETRAPHLPAEWALQSGIQLTWPHAGTDWTYMLDAGMFCSHCPRNSRPGDIADCNPRTG